MARIVALDTSDVRFPTSLSLHGADVMNPNPDHSAACVRIRTDAGDGHNGHGFVFTIGRRNEVQVAAVRALAAYLVGRDLDDMLDDLGRVWRELVYDSQLRWLGPEKGVMRMVVGAVVNAFWDLGARRADALTRDDALLAGGYDDTFARLCREAVTDGFTQIMFTVGADLAEDIRRLGVVRGVCGPGVDENLAILLLAAEFGGPRAGGVGSIDHLHEHFRTPVGVVAGRYRAPKAPGAGVQLLDRSIVEYTHG